jgi:hypothetical protein
MSLTNIQATDTVKDSRQVINDNFTYLEGEIALKADQTALDTTNTTVGTKADDNAVVKLTGTQTVAGVKTFSSSPVVPTPTTDMQASTKKYVDDIAFAGVPDASETVAGKVELATSAEVTAGTDTGSTGAPLVVVPSKINAEINKFNPTVTELIPQSIYGYSDTPSSTQPTDTSARIGLVVIPHRIIVNKVSLRTGLNTSTSPLDVSLYSRDGNTRLFAVSSAGTHAANTIVTISISGVEVLPGHYWLMVNTDTSTLMQVIAYTEPVPFTATQGFNNGVSGEPVLSGTLAITSGTPPATINPSSIAAAINSIVIVRLDN